MKLIVYIGRFQPFHYGHLGQIRNEYKDMDCDGQQVKLLMLLGTESRVEHRTFKNPFFYGERRQMILDSLEDNELHHINIEPIYDHPSDKVWQYDVIQLINKYKQDYFKDDVYLIGDADETSSYYLAKFPEFMYTGIAHDGVHATDVRNAYFKEILCKWEDKAINHSMLNIASVKDMVPAGTFQFLKNHAVDNELISIARAQADIEKYKGVK